MAEKASSKKSPIADNGNNTNTEQGRSAEEIVRASQSDPERPVRRADGKVLTTSLEEKRDDLGEPQDDTAVNEVSRAVRSDEENYAGDVNNGRPGDEDTTSKKK